MLKTQTPLESLLQKTRPTAGIKATEYTPKTPGFTTGQTTGQYKPVVKRISVSQKITPNTRKDTQYIAPKAKFAPKVVPNAVPTTPKTGLPANKITMKNSNAYKRVKYQSNILQGINKPLKSY